MGAKPRINKYDNLKGIAIFLVVLCHFNFLGLLGGSINKFIFMIHLPLLFFVAGYFSKIGPDEPIKSFKRLLIPYIIFCAITRLFNWLVLGHFNFDMIFIKPSFALWFLIALFLMKMALPIVNKFKYPILISIICALFIGLINIESNILGLTRAFGYFPIFLVGFYFKQTKNGLSTQYEKIVNLFNKHYKLIGLLIIILIIIVCIRFDNRVILFKKAYVGNPIKEVIKRLIVILLQIGAVLIFDKLMTNRNCLLTKFGINSMAVYILHCYVRLYLDATLPKSFISNPILGLVFTFGLAFIVTYVFSRDAVSKYLNKFTDGIYDLIVKPN